MSVRKKSLSPLMIETVAYLSSDHLLVHAFLNCFNRTQGKLVLSLVVTLY